MINLTDVWYYIGMSEITVLVLLTIFCSMIAYSLYLSEQRINNDSDRLTLLDLIYMIFSTKPSSL